jgi:haloacetate dehalogenase
MSVMFEGFERKRVGAPGADINLVVGGTGPPVLLLHGYPQTHVMWHKIAPALAERFTVVAADLRGYDDSSKPPGGPDHAGYAKRAMAADQAAVMEGLGFDAFSVVGHDRGARVGLRMALDYPERVARFVVLDVVPTADIFGRVDDALATAYFHWFMMLQPEPLAETLIGGAPEFWLRWVLDRWSTVPRAFTDEALAEYQRCWTPETIHAACEDYRAVAVDLEDDAKDSDQILRCPIQVLWGAHRGQHPGWPSVAFDMIAVWRARAADVRGRGLPCGHFMPEEAAAETLAEIVPFLEGS